MTVFVPDASAAGAEPLAGGATRRPILSPGTKSLFIKYGRYGASVGSERLYDVGPKAPGCQAASGGAQCILQFDVPQYTQDISFGAYSGIVHDGRSTGSVLDAGRSTQTIDRSTQLAFTMTAAVHKIRITSLLATPSSGVVSDLHFHFDALDAAGFEVRGAYGDSTGTPTPLLIKLPLDGYGNSPFTTSVNGKANFTTINSSLDKYDIKYLGRGILSGFIEIETEFGYEELASAPFNPTPAFLAVPGSPPLTSASEIVSPGDGSVWFNDPASSKIGTISGGQLTEQSLPSAHTPVKLAFAYYYAPLVRVAFETSQSTVGTIDNQRDVTESAPIAGAPITAFAYDTYYQQPIYAQGGTISEWWGNKQPASVEQIGGNANVTSITSGSGSAFFVDSGTGMWGAYSYLDPTYNTEKALPAGSGTPAFVDTGSNGVWIAISGQPKVVVSSANVTTVTTAAPITAMTAGSGIFADEIATDSSGNIEVFDKNGTLLKVYVPPGSASDIVTGPDEDFYYVCTSCAQGVYEFIP